MAKVWTKYRKDEQPYFNTTFQMRSGTSAPRNLAYKQVTYNPRTTQYPSGQWPGFPDRMLVETIPITGPNRGFAFVSKGASVVDNDGGKVGSSRVVSSSLFSDAERRHPPPGPTLPPGRRGCGLCFCASGGPAFCRVLIGVMFRVPTASPNTV